jgi:hypothetical protein
MYKSTAQGVMKWANAELKHVGRIASVEDPDVQYAYAISTVNGMMHLRQALAELVDNNDYTHYHADLKKTHDGVVRVIKHLIKDYNIDLETIKAFNTRHVLKSFNMYEVNNTRRNVLIRNNTRKNKNLD